MVARVLGPALEIRFPEFLILTGAKSLNKELLAFKVRQLSLDSTQRLSTA